MSLSPLCLLAYLFVSVFLCLLVSGLLLCVSSCLSLCLSVSIFVSCLCDSVSFWGSNRDPPCFPLSLHVPGVGCWGLDRFPDIWTPADLRGSDASLVPKERIVPLTLGFIHSRESLIRSSSYPRLKTLWESGNFKSHFKLRALLSKAVPRFPGVSRSILRVTLALLPSTALRQPHSQQTAPFYRRCPRNSRERARESGVGSRSPPTPHHSPAPPRITTLGGGGRCLRVPESLCGVALGLGEEGGGS